MDHTEAEAIHDSGRDACVKVLLALAIQVQRLEGRVERLEGEVRELRRDSDNSSLPPSADPGAGKRRRKGKRSPRNPGAQPGHPGSGRGLLPIEQVAEVIEHLPESCAQCGHSLADRPARGPIRRHQVAELPETAVAVTEHRLCRRRCPDCGALTQAELPPEIPASASAPGFREPSPPSPRAFGSPAARWPISAASSSGSQIAVGSVDAVLQRQGIALREPQKRLCDAVRSAPVLCVDETGWKQAGERRFLWGAFADRAAVLRVAPSRHREEAEELLGSSTEAIVSSDRWWAYDHLDPARRQVCSVAPSARLSLPRRESDRRPERVRRGLSGGRRERVSAWRAFQHSGDRRALRREIAPLERELRALCEARKRKSAKTRYHRGLARNLIKVWPALWNFIEAEGVEPTNNRAERGLRHAVIYRKLSQGNRSAQGALATERLLSAAISCRLQRRSLFAYLVEVTEASIRGQPRPALV